MARNNKVCRLRPGLFKDIVAFHKKFKLGYSGPPRKLDIDIARARYRHQFEELQEFLVNNLKSQYFSIFII